jgi:hypothetical protein
MKEFFARAETYGKAHWKELTALALAAIPALFLLFHKGARQAAGNAITYIPAQFGGGSASSGDTSSSKPPPAPPPPPSGPPPTPPGATPPLPGFGAASDTARQQIDNWVAWAISTLPPGSGPSPTPPDYNFWSAFIQLHGPDATKQAIYNAYGAPAAPSSPAPSAQAPRLSIDGNTGTHVPAPSVRTRLGVMNKSLPA